MTLNPPILRSPPIELTILMPCLNEARTVVTCIRKAREFLDRAGIVGEVLIADNGSTDGSQRLALQAGARTIDVDRRGYGAALIAGIHAARGRLVIMGDADDSYAFDRLDAFVERLRAGDELVMGNRFAGGIEPGAMPALHRYLGNPVLSFVGRRFFGGTLRDFHCGLRGFRRDAVLKLGLVAPGMEFASELIVKALQAGLAIGEVPTALAKDGRDRPPHLRTWRDGWRHLRFLLLFAPRWLFLYPGLALAFAGLFQLAVANAAPHGLGRWPVGIHTQLFAAVAVILGYQTALFALGAVLARRGAGLDTSHPRERWALRAVRSPWLAAGGALATLLGFVSCAVLAWRWGRGGFGALDPDVAMRQIIPATALMVVGSLSLLAAVFFAAMQSAFESGRGGRHLSAALRAQAESAE